MTTTKFQFATEEYKTAETRKKELRAHMKERRAQNENRDVKESLQIENLFRVFDEMQGAGTCLTVFVYLSYSSESPTDRLIETLIEGGYTVCCPRVEKDRLLAVEYGEDITLSDYGIREPVGEPFQGKIDVSITPFLAVDEKGNRLGYGGGYYDRFFTENPDVLRIAYGYDFQVVKEVPSEPWDKKMQYVVTDKRIVKIDSEQKKI
jgi:5-formyltetrahydrofolate cyclo-ligase